MEKKQNENIYHTYTKCHGSNYHTGIIIKFSWSASKWVEKIRPNLNLTMERVALDNRIYDCWIIIYRGISSLRMLKHFGTATKISWAELGNCRCYSCLRRSHPTSTVVHWHWIETETSAFTLSEPIIKWRNCNAWWILESIILSIRFLKFPGNKFSSDCI